MKRTKYLTLLFLLPLSYQSIQGQEHTIQTDAFDLEKVWQYTEAQYKKLAIIRLQATEKQEDIKQIESSRLPSIKLEGSYSKRSDMPLYKDGFLHQPTVVPLHATQYGTSLSADLLLYEGNQKNRAIQIEKVGLQTINTQLLKSTAEAKIESTKLFYALVLHQHYKELVIKEIAQDEKQLRDIISLYQNGTILKSDVLRAEVTLSNHQMLLKEIENNLVLLRQQLNLMMGRTETEILTPLYPDLDTLPELASYDENLNQALEQAYALQLADQHLEQGTLVLKQIQARILPKLSLFADYGFSFPQNKSYPYTQALYGLGQVGLKLSIPLSNLYHIQHQKSKQKILIQQQQVEKEEKIDQIKNELQRYFVQYQESLDRIALAEKTISQTTETLRILRNSYFNQQALLLDLLDAETQVLQAQFNLTSAKINAKIEYYQIQKTIGNI
ncbi:TolC family protein [Myroides sp. DW712]|uniref:TolC family protein n=1 Tax=Myroides sp. DW712 TaxID=3389800 RepID=UPI00397B9258